MAVIIDYRILLYSEDTKFLEGLKSAITDIMNLYHIKNDLHLQIMDDILILNLNNSFINHVVKSNNYKINELEFFLL